MYGAPTTSSISVHKKPKQPTHKTHNRHELLSRDIRFAREATTTIPKVQSTETTTKGTGATLAIDVESFEHSNGQLVTEIGWDCIRHVLIHNEDERKGKRKIARVRDTVHVVVSENQGLHNGSYVPDHYSKYNFDFGDSSLCKLADAVKTLNKLIQELHSQYSPLQLILHGAQAEMNYFEKMGIELPPRSTFLLFDTAKMYERYVNRPGTKTNLGAACSGLGIRTSHLHNAGNDARFTADCFLRMTDKSLEWPDL